MREFKAEIVYLDPKSLTPYARNTNKHSTEQIDKLAGQIAAHGFDQPIVVDKDKVIIKGHGRREASLRLNMTLVPVIVAFHLNEFETMAARIADNELASQSERDEEMMQFEIGTLNRNDFDLGLTGMDQDKYMDFLKEPDNFEPGSTDDQGKLDEKKKITCPNCQHEFEN